MLNRKLISVDAVDHKKLKTLSARVEKNMTKLFTEAINLLMEKYD